MLGGVFIYIPYNRESALEYVKAWALKRNPSYFNFDTLGGDCTNFVSQVLFSGGSAMNYTKDFGWYYSSLNDRSPSWTNANFLYKFLINNKVTGPFANIVGINNIMVGDIVQLFFNQSQIPNHSLIISGFNGWGDYSNILVSSHTRDRYNHPLTSITFEKVQFLHIIGSNR